MRKATRIVLGSAAGLTGIIIAASAAGSGGSDSSSPPAVATSTATHKASGPDRVCFAVTGTGNPTISYGSDSDSRDAGGRVDAGNNLPWHACMDANQGALYWDVMAQLQGGGDITATVTEVKPDGTKEILATGHASGGYEIAHAESVAG